MHNKHKGFTIVELLIVIVVIAILAAISIVAYNGIQERARYSSMRSDLASLNKAIQLYYADNGQYPVTPNPCAPRSDPWCGSDQTKGNSFIPGIIPVYISMTPQLPEENSASDTYLYMSNGINYKLMRYKNVGLSASEAAAMIDLRAVCSGNPQTDRWGYWSSDTSKCW